MTDVCARLGCGAPKAWHGTKATLDELLAWRDERHEYPVMLVSGGSGVCQGNKCACSGYLAPEPPQPEPYVVMLTRDQSGLAGIPLADYLVSRPQPAPRLCICGGDADDHNPVTGRCEHVAKWMTVAAAHGEPRRDDWIETHYCSCRRFISEEAQP